MPLFSESIVEDAALAWLEALHEVLLPKRISDELRVKDAEGIAGATA